MTHEYTFLDKWRVKGTVSEVDAIMSDAPGFANWWPAFVLSGKLLTQGDEKGVGAVYDWQLKGWLPYIVRFKTRVIASQTPHGYSIEAFGDLNGKGIWSFVQDGEWVTITYDWRVNADRPLLRYGSFIAKPLLTSNHRWAMIKGEESLRLEVLRRHATTAEERQRIPPPPAPVSPNLGASLQELLRWVRRRQSSFNQSVKQSQ
jgi:hypothetical protein